MKKINLILITAVMAGASAFGQSGIITAPVPVTNGVTGTLAGPTVMAELFYGPLASPEGSLTPVLPPVSLTSGYAQFGSVMLPYTPGTTVELQVRAWDDNSGLYPQWTSAQAAWLAGQILGGKSVLADALTQTVPGPAVTFPGFTIYQVPEPSSAALGLLILALWQARRARTQP
jgi:hypothetical protein